MTDRTALIKKIVIAGMYDPPKCVVLKAIMELLKERRVAAIAVCSEFIIIKSFPPPPAIDKYIDGCKLFGAPILNITM